MVKSRGYDPRRMTIRMTGTILSAGRRVLHRHDKARRRIHQLDLAAGRGFNPGNE
jgi:hypothetical protein